MGFRAPAPLRSRSRSLPRARSPRVRFPELDGYRVVPESHREWSWWGDGRTGFPVRAGRDRKTVCDGFYAISKTGPFKVYTFEHEVPESGPSPEDTELARSFPDRFEIIFETHFIGLKDIYIYGDEKDSEGRSGLLLITGR